MKRKNDRYKIIIFILYYCFFFVFYIHSYIHMYAKKRRSTHAHARIYLHTYKQRCCWFCCCLQQRLLTAYRQCRSVRVDLTPSTPTATTAPALCSVSGVRATTRPVPSLLHGTCITTNAHARLSRAGKFTCKYQ